MAHKTPGQLAYEAEIAAAPYYHDGTRRPPWAKLDDVQRWSWERAPNPRQWVLDSPLYKRARLPVIEGQYEVVR